MAQKVIRIGSSAGITLSQDALKALKVKIGSEIEMSVSKKLGVIVIKSAKNSTPINLEVIAWTEEFIDKYGDALKALAKK